MTGTTGTDMKIISLESVSRIPAQVESTAKNITTNFTLTAELLLQTALKLEARAADLREKANAISEQTQLANDLREWVKYERTAFEEVKSLALVDVGIND